MPYLAANSLFIIGTLATPFLVFLALESDKPGRRVFAFITVYIIILFSVVAYTIGKEESLPLLAWALFISLVTCVLLLTRWAREKTPPERETNHRHHLAFSIFNCVGVLVIFFSTADESVSNFISGRLLFWDDPIPGTGDLSDWQSVIQLIIGLYVSLVAFVPIVGKLLIEERDVIQGAIDKCNESSMYLTILNKQTDATRARTREKIAKLDYLKARNTRSYMDSVYDYYVFFPLTVMAIILVGVLVYSSAHPCTLVTWGGAIAIIMSISPNFAILIGILSTWVDTRTRKIEIEVLMKEGA